MARLIVLILKLGRRKRKKVDVPVSVVARVHE